MKFPKAFVLIVLCSSLFLAGCVKITDEYGNDLKIAKEGGYYTLSGAIVDTGSKELVAIVKGSIYETGESMAVFGTCLDSFDDPINGTYGLFDAWYPNGTQFIFSDNMTNIGVDGHYVHWSNMQAVGGTYLTRLTCRIAGDNVTKAYAFGEWQNPVWVARIGNLTNATNDIQNSLNNITITLANFSIEIEDSFNITWSKLDQINATINNTFIQLNESIYYIASVANSSVDRNDSYLALLIQNLTGNLFGNNSGNPLAYEIVRVDDFVYMRDWSIRVNAVDTGGGVIQYPDSLCYITTSQTANTLMTPNGNQWRFNEVLRVSPYTYAITCQFA